MSDLLDNPVAAARAAELASRYDVDAATAAVLARYHFDAETFDCLRSGLAEHGLDPELNWVTGDVVGPQPDDLRSLPPLGTEERSRLDTLGREAIAEGSVGVLLLAGGMATRFGGGVKALADVLPGLRFVDVKLADLVHLADSMGATIPMMLMTSFQSDQVLAEVGAELGTDRVPVTTAPQAISMRVDPNGDIHRTTDGSVSLYAPGHGDVPFALQTSGALESFVGGGGRQIFVTNVDNAAATLDPAIIGLHLDGGREMTCEVTGGNLNGGAPYFVDGHLQILEEFRIPAHVDTAAPLAVNTNSMVLEASALAGDHPLTWFQVSKQVEGQSVVQFERLVGELSAFLSTTMAVVERDGSDGRFQPVKDPAELEQRRPAIREILEARSVI
ncbi:MAG: UTP--glucose-1-phosphate uridylyltransferase [Actinomycetota bacterium]|jgi:UTP--glucose-1-phosphate uridylyltransferase|nr:UTP--glucose-1-phosphate uridylyltransferase [Actinomycetota bacterium]